LETRVSGNPEERAFFVEMEPVLAAEQAEAEAAHVAWRE
jgi:hypothetical protein